MVTSSLFDLILKFSFVVGCLQSQHGVEYEAPKKSGIFWLFYGIVGLFYYFWNPRFK